jgi:protein gp37
MGTETAIEWAHATWNPWMGCHKVSPGCKHCYMYRDLKRWGRDPMRVSRAQFATFFAPQIWARYWNSPREIKKTPPKPGSRIFTCSWSDWFHADADEWRNEAWNVVKNTPYTYLILTKRVENVLDRLPADWGEGYPNVWLGVSVENQDYMYRAEELAKINARVRFISYEPALGQIDLPDTVARRFQWLISGGESHGRPAELDWFRHIRGQCGYHGIHYFHKQNGGNTKIDGAWGGKELDGLVWQEFPA